jgi:hemolysin activation/secretion protein
MRFFIFVVVFLSFSVFSSALRTLPAIAAESAAPSQEKIEQQTEQVRSQKISPKMEVKTPKTNKNPAPTTFQPTERIDADTVIAFPVDI